MSKFTSPLDNIRIASPCSADWEGMFGSDRKRFCGDCKLNVYNLSNMSRQEAENLILSSEGRLCVRFFRRADGTILTMNCPVGWAAVKQRASRMATAAFSMIAGVLTGILGFNLLKSESPAPRHQMMGAIAIQGDIAEPDHPVMGGIRPAIDQIESGEYVNGRMEMGKSSISPNTRHQK
ncbi:hypothetical protein BH20ACI2_BH20ACI2_08410 [soil metagenome]